MGFLWSLLNAPDPPPPPSRYIVYDNGQKFEVDKEYANTGDDEGWLIGISEVITGGYVEHRYQYRTK